MSQHGTFGNSCKAEQQQLRCIAETYTWPLAMDRGQTTAPWKDSQRQQYREFALADWVILPPQVLPTSLPTSCSSFLAWIHVTLLKQVHTWYPD